MGFSIFMLCMNVLLPIVMIVFGYRFKNQPPRDINMSYGYRTKRSMINQDTWDFAHHACGKLFYKWGFISLVICTIASFAVWNQSYDVVGDMGMIVMFFNVALLLFIVVKVEKQLQASFDLEGKKK